MNDDRVYLEYIVDCIDKIKKTVGWANHRLISTAYKLLKFAHLTTEVFLYQSGFSYDQIGKRI